MLNFPFHLVALGSLAPIALWLGSRHAIRAERRDRTGGRPVTAGCERTPAATITGAADDDDERPSGILSGVAVVNGELLVQLTSTESTGGAEEVSDGAEGVYDGRAPHVTWLGARPDPAVIQAAERCHADLDLVHHRTASAHRVVLDLGGTIIPMLRLTDRSGRAPS